MPEGRAGLKSDAVLSRLGRGALESFRRRSSQAAFAGRLALVTWQGRRGRWRLILRLTLDEVAKLILGSIPLIILVGALIGFLWSVIWYDTLEGIPGQENLTAFLVNIHALEISPILTMVIVLLRYGAPATWEVAAMKSGWQFQTLAGLGIPPEHYLGTPRILGALLTFTPLLAFFNLASYAGAYFYGWRSTGLPIWDFIHSFSGHSTPGQIITLGLKSFFISLAIPFFCVYNGFQTPQGNLDQQEAHIIRRAMGEAFFFSILGTSLVSILV